MRLLILGGTGFVGGKIGRLAQEHGHFVAATTRRAIEPNGARFELHTADRRSPDRFVELARSLRIDCIVDCAAYTDADTATLTTALDGEVARYVLLSSGDVYQNYGILNRREAGPPINGWLTETSPLRTSRFPYRADKPRDPTDPRRWMDDYEKILVENCACTFKRTPHTILRLPMVYGPGDRQHRFAWIIAPAKTATPTLTLPRAWAEWRATYGFIDNIAAAILLAASHDRAANQTFNLGEPEPATHAEWAQRFATALNWKGAIELSDDPNLPLAQLTATMDLSVSLLMSTTRIQAELGYADPVPLTDAIDKTICS